MALNFKLRICMMFILSLQFLSCSKKEVDSSDGEEISLLCDWNPKYRAGRKITSIEGTINYYKIRASSGSYVVNIGMENVETGNLAPCNLPDSLNEEGKKVKITGYLVTYDGIEMVNHYAMPFEITELNVIQ